MLAYASCVTIIVVFWELYILLFYLRAVQCFEMCDGFKRALLVGIIIHCHLSGKAKAAALSPNFKRLRGNDIFVNRL